MILQSRLLRIIFYGTLLVSFSSVQFSHSVMSDTLRPMNRSTPGLPVHHQLPEFTQIHVHWVRDAIQPSHPLSSPSLTFNLSQHQGLFKWVSSSQFVDCVDVCKCWYVYEFLKDKMEIKKNGETYQWMQADLEFEIITIALDVAVPNNEIWLKFTNSIAKLPDL